MLRHALRKLLCAAVVAVAIVSLTASRADAGWYHWGGHCGWGGYGYYGAYYAPVYSYSYRPYVLSYGWSCYTPVVYRSCYRPRYTPYYSSCYSSCYSPCYSTYTPCGCDYCCGTAIGCCTGKVVVESPAATIEPEPDESAAPAPAPPEPAPVDELAPDAAGDMPTPPPPAPSSPLPEPTLDEPAPVAPAPPAPAPADAAPPAPAPAEPGLDLPTLPESPALPPAPGGANNRSNGRNAVLSVVVPEDAKVYVNGILTKTPGTHRRYVSHGLVPGFRYTYEVEAVVRRSGRLIRDRQVIDVRAGETRDLALNLNRAPSASSVATQLTVHVPEDAEVQLEGRTAAATGTVRRFTTTDLPRGEQWEDYRVVATLQRNGLPVRQEKTLRMIGGESHELRFEFDSERLALR